MKRLLIFMLLALTTCFISCNDNHLKIDKLLSDVNPRDVKTIKITANGRSYEFSQITMIDQLFEVLNVSCVRNNGLFGTQTPDSEKHYLYIIMKDRSQIRLFYEQRTVENQTRPVPILYREDVPYYFINENYDMRQYYVYLVPYV